MLTVAHMHSDHRPSLNQDAIEQANDAIILPSSRYTPSATWPSLESTGGPPSLESTGGPPSLTTWAQHRRKLVAGI
jgi:hypothetical protein